MFVSLGDNFYETGVKNTGKVTYFFLDLVLHNYASSIVLLFSQKNFQKNVQKNFQKNVQNKISIKFSIQVGDQEKR